MNINTYRVGPHSWSTIVSNFGNIELSHYLLRRKWARGNFWEGSQTQRHDMVTSCATGGSPIGVGEPSQQPMTAESCDLWPITAGLCSLSGRACWHLGIRSVARDSVLRCFVSLGSLLLGICDWTWHYKLDIEYLQPKPDIIRLLTDTNTGLMPLTTL